jgi:hypothetical protein
MHLTPRARKLLLASHVTSSVGWAGALAVFLAHAALSLSSQDTFVVRAAAFAMATSAWLVILPLSIASLVTGVVQAAGSAWGLLKHYWVVFKLVLTVLATAVLLSKLGPISQLALLSQDSGFSPVDARPLGLSMLVHAVGGLLVLGAALVLAFWKPAGRLRWAATGGELRPSPIPTWVLLSAALLAGLLLLVALMVALGTHGPRMH